MCLHSSFFVVDEKIIGYIGILISVDYLIAYIAGVGPNVSFPIAVINLLYSGALLISSGLLVLGVSNKRSAFLIPYLVVSVFKMILLIVVFILNMIAGSIILFLIFVVNTAFWGYCGLCVFSLFKRLRSPAHNIGVA